MRGVGAGAGNWELGIGNWELVGVSLINYIV